MKILLGYSYYSYQVDIKDWVNDWLKRVNKGLDIQIDSFCLTLNPPGPRLTWMEIEKKWNEKDPSLIKMYDELASTVEGYDAFINWNGINLHPEFVKNLKTYTVFGCFDDPETSEDLSMPVATAYDLCLIGNIAEVDTYKKWGVKNVEWWPMGFHSEDYDCNLTEEKILKGERSNGIALLCERTSGWRKQRLDKLYEAFPHGAYFGNGWDNGFLPESKKIDLLQDTKIGPNFHNSTGPINFRTFILPANGVMQVCDNKSHLGKVFKLGEEVVGFDTVEECIELCKYYLSHDEERKRIAAAGWKRAMKDYNEVAVFKIAIDHIKNGIKNKLREKDENFKFTKQEISNFWEYEYKYPQSYFEILEGEDFFAALKKYFKGAKNALDFASGPGFFKHLLENKIKVTALNFHVDYLRTVNKIYKRKRFFKGAFDLDKVKHSGDKFDIITAVEVVERINSFYLKEMMISIKSLLSDKGLAIITVRKNNSSNLEKICKSQKCWSEEELREYIKDKEFEVVEIFEAKFAKKQEFFQDNNILNKIQSFFVGADKTNPCITTSEDRMHLVCIFKNKN